MRIGRVMGHVVCSRQWPRIPAGRFLIVEALDAAALQGHEAVARRAQPMPESLVVYDNLGAGLGQLIAISEGGEAAQPFLPDPVPCDAFCAAILDRIDLPAGGKAGGAET